MLTYYLLLIIITFLNAYPIDDPKFRHNDFLVEMKYVHFKIKILCEINKDSYEISLEKDDRDCDHINEIINETIHLINTEDIYNIKLSYELKNNNYNLRIRIVNPGTINSETNMGKGSTLGGTFGNIFKDSFILYCFLTFITHLSYLSLSSLPT